MQGREGDKVMSSDFAMPSGSFLEIVYRVLAASEAIGLQGLSSPEPKRLGQNLKAGPTQIRLRERSRKETESPRID